MPTFSRTCSGGLLFSHLLLVQLHFPLYFPRVAKSVANEIAVHLRVQNFAAGVQLRQIKMRKLGPVVGGRLACPLPKIFSYTMPSTSKDMFDLKLRKKLLSQQLSMVDDKFDRMARILDKKLTQKGLPTKQTSTLSKTKPKVRGGVPSPPRKSLMKPQPIESGSQFDMVRKRNVIRHQKALLERKVSCERWWCGEGGEGVAERWLRGGCVPGKYQAVRRFWGISFIHLLCEGRKEVGCGQRGSIPMTDGHHPLTPLPHLPNHQPRKRIEPKKTNPFSINKNVPVSLLPRRYTRGELPCTVEHRSSGLALSWMCPLHNLDYEHYLPIFMDGIRCTENPHQFIAKQGVYELIEDARGDSKRILDVLDICVLPMRYALSTKNPDVVLRIINILKQLCTVHPSCGPRLIPHYRQILGILNLFYQKPGKSLGDAMDYKQFKSDDLVVPIAEVLNMMEGCGGPNAFVNIKFMVPTYTSAFHNPGAA